MQLSEFLELVRAGKVNLISHYSALEGEAMFKLDYKNGIPTVLHKEIIEVIRENQAILYLFVKSNDITVCNDIENHKPYHVPSIVLDQEYVRCDECARIRKQKESTDEELLKFNERINLREER